MEELVKQWFNHWEKGDFLNLPITADFKHTSPFGTIDGKAAYLKLVQENKDKFLGYTFIIHDAIYGTTRACVRYTATQGQDFTLDVAEWYYAEKQMIKQIVAYYHIGDIREDRKIDDYN